MAETEISLDEIISARDKCARIVAVFGSRYLPIFERLETELTERQKKQQLLEKALQISSASGTQSGTQNGTHQHFNFGGLAEKFNAIN